MSEPKPITLAKTDAESVHLNRLRAVEDEVYESSMSVIRDVMRFRDIDMTQEHPPAKWVEQYGAQEAVRMFRVAKAAWLSMKEAPAALRTAEHIYLGIAKARAAVKSAPQSLAVAIVIGADARKYEEIEVKT